MKRITRCEVYGNDYALSFECAIHALVPVCEHRGVRVIGHGVQADGALFCCAYCARKAGKSWVRDRV